MKQAQKTWEEYAKTWKLESIEEKEAGFSNCLSPSCVYRDPLKVARGYKELGEYMVEFHSQVPGGHFVTEEFHFHNDRSIAHWRMVGGDGTKLGVGTSFGEYDAEGKLVSMTGFFETPDGPSNEAND